MYETGLKPFPWQRDGAVSLRSVSISEEFLADLRCRWRREASGSGRALILEAGHFLLTSTIVISPDETKQVFSASLAGG